MKRLSNYIGINGNEIPQFGNAIPYLAKVVSYTPGHEAYTTVTSVVISNFIDDYTYLNGQYVVTEETAQNKNLKDKVFFNATASKYLYLYDGSQDYGTSYWCIASNTSTIFYQTTACIATDSTYSIPTTGTWNVYYYMYQQNNIGAEAITTSFPQTTTSLVCQKVVGYTDNLGIRTYNTSDDLINCTVIDQTPVENGLCLISGTRFIMQMRNTEKQLFGIMNGCIRYATLSSDSSEDYLNNQMSKANSGVSYITDSQLVLQNEATTILQCNQYGYVQYSQGISGLTSFTISCWINSPLDSWSYLTFSGASGGDSNQWSHNGCQIWIGDHPDIGKLSVTNGAGQADSTILQATNVPTGWKHIALVWTGNSFKLYINGAQQGLESNSNINFTNKACYLSVNNIHRAPNVVPANGQYSSLRLFNRVLNQTQIIQLANQFTVVNS